MAAAGAVYRYAGAGARPGPAHAAAGAGLESDAGVLPNTRFVVNSTNGSVTPEIGLTLFYKGVSGKELYGAEHTKKSLAPCTKYRVYLPEGVTSMGVVIRLFDRANKQCGRLSQTLRAPFPNINWIQIEEAPKGSNIKPIKFFSSKEKPGSGDMQWNRFAATRSEIERVLRPIGMRLAPDPDKAPVEKSPSEASVGAGAAASAAARDERSVVRSEDEEPLEIMLNSGKKSPFDIQLEMTVSGVSTPVLHAFHTTDPFYAVQITFDRVVKGLNCHLQKVGTLSRDIYVGGLKPPFSGTCWLQVPQQEGEAYFGFGAKKVEKVNWEIEERGLYGASRNDDTDEDWVPPKDRLENKDNEKTVPYLNEGYSEATAEIARREAAAGAGAGSAE